MPFGSFGGGMKSIDGVNRFNEIGALTAPLNLKKSVEGTPQKEVDKIGLSTDKRVKEEVRVDKRVEEEVSAEERDKESTKENQEKVIDELKQNLSRLNQYIPVTSTNLVFEFDEQDSSPFIKVFDKESNEIIREIPSKEFREIAKALGEFAEKLEKKGVLLDETV